MNPSPILSPALLQAFAVFTVAVSVLMVATHTHLLAGAARRTTLAPAVQFRVPLIAAALLAAWLGWAVLAVDNRVVAPEPPPVAGEGVQRPELLLEMMLFVAAGIALLFGSRTMRTLNTAMPPAWLIGVQTYRVAGVMFLWPFLAADALPAGFAWPAGIGDTLTGLAAPFVAWAVARNRPGAHQWAVAWNWFGLLDLTVAPIAAVMSHSTNIGRFPLVVVPLFLGPPLGILTHIYSLRNLRANRAQTAAAHQDRPTFSASTEVS